ncbi:phosphotransferase family protein [Natronomonas sp. EA1]|uniref:phosphotransferase family protein n=1 Tax=Natronomonas sp. EA1 TaxID=3421655 RepID=UPI003EBF5393
MIAFETLLAREYPDRTVMEVTPAATGNRKATATVTFADGERVVVQRADRPGALRTELALQRAIRERTGVVVPAVLREGEGYAVVAHREGRDLHTHLVDLPAEEQAAVARAFGRALAELHGAFAFSGVGPLDPSLDATGAWDAWFPAYVRAGLAALPPALADLREPMEAAVEALDAPTTEPRLYPWDLRPGNALYDGTVTFLDWGDPLAAPAGLAIAKAEHLVCDWYTDGLHEPFRAGYRERRPLPPVPDAYRAVAVVRSAVDSRGAVTRPGYPEREGAAAVDFHRKRLEAVL